MRRKGEFIQAKRTGRINDLVRDFFSILSGEVNIFIVQNIVGFQNMASVAQSRPREKIISIEREMDRTNFTPSFLYPWVSSADFLPLIFLFL